MSIMKKMGTAIAALSMLTATSAMATVRPASTVGASSIQGIQRASARVGDTSNNAIAGIGIVIAALAGTAFIVGILVITDVIDNGDDSPTSP